ncbi:MAG: ABC transporter ATP-binding protein [Gemmataceae bacterium]
MSNETSYERQRHFDSSSTDRTLATLFSVSSGACLLLLLPICYLFVDLLVWKGRVPSYSQLPVGRQIEFRNQWNTNPNSNDVIGKALIRNAGPANQRREVEEWETCWQSSLVDAFGKVRPAAAEEYIRLPVNDSDSLPHYVHAKTETRLGILPTVALENGRWTGIILEKVAAILPMTWNPGESGSANTSYLLTLFTVAFFLTLAGGFFSLAARHFSSQAAVETGSKLRRSLYLQAFRLGSVAVSPVARAEAAGLLTTHVDLICEHIETSSRIRVRNWFVAWGAILVLFLINPLIAIIVIGGGGAFWLAVGQVASWFRRDSRRAARLAEAARVRLGESVERMGLTKAYQMDRFAQNRFERQLDEVANAERRRTRGQALTRPMLLALGGVAIAILAFILGEMILGGTISLAGATEMTAGATMIAWALRSGLHGRHVARTAQAAKAEIAEFLQRRGDMGQPIDAEFLQPLSKQIEFLSLSVREPGTGTMLLDEVTATIRAGSRVAVVSDQRESMQAFSHVLSRFVESTAGEIKIDGKNLRWVTTDSLRAQIVVVSEDSLTFMDTVSNNIGCGDPGFGLPQIMEAAKVAHAHQFIQKLPFGYETSIGGSGTVLTPGQQYRIALARAILRDPSVLVIEEPTVALDPDTLALVDDTLARIQEGRTIIVLANRESTMRRSDQILVFEKGRVVASGNHHMLVQSSELYRRLGYRESSNGSRLTERV